MRTIALCLIAISLGIAGLSFSIAAADDGSGSAVSPAPAPASPPTIVDQLKDLQARYMALKANSDKSAKLLLYAALLAAGLKLLLSGVNLLAGRKPTKWLAWIALGLAVPIALLSYYAAGNSLFESLVYAGSGPGAIVVHELLKLFAKKPAEVTA